MQVKRLRTILKRLVKLYDIDYHNVGFGDRQIVISDQNDIQVARLSTRDDSVWIDFRLVEDKEFPEDTEIDRFKEAVKESPDDDIPF